MCHTNIYLKWDFFYIHTKTHKHTEQYSPIGEKMLLKFKKKSPTLFSSPLLSPVFLFNLFYLSQMLNLHPWKPSDDYRVSS